MSPPKAPSDENTLPARDFWLLPLVALSTAFIFGGVLEVAAGAMFAESGGFTTCEVKDSARGLRYRPNSTCSVKSAEGPLVDYRFNDCGYRSAKTCATKPRDTLRIALIGTSITLGFHVPADEAFASRTEKALNRMCSQPVEIQNLGRVVGPSALPDMTSEALGLSPDVIVLTVSPFDISGPSSPAQSTVSPDSARGISRIKLAWDKLKVGLRHSETYLAATHFGLMNEQLIYQSFLRNITQRDVMTFPLTTSGERMYAEFAATFDRIIARLDGSSVPLVVMALPNRVQAMLLSSHSSNFPMAESFAHGFGRHIGEIAVQHGALPFDTAPEFALFPHAERLFYPVDGHPTGDGHSIIARALLERLTNGSIPQLTGCGASAPPR